MVRWNTGAGLVSGGVVFIAAVGKAGDGLVSGRDRRRFGAAAALDRVASRGGAFKGNGFCDLRRAGRYDEARSRTFCAAAHLSSTGFANGALQDFEDGEGQ